MLSAWSPSAALSWCLVKEHQKTEDSEAVRIAGFGTCSHPSFSLFSFSTASNSNKSTPACSPVLRKRSRSPTPQSQEGENMVEKGSDHSSDKSPSTPEQVVQRTYSLQSARSGGKNSKVSGQETPRLPDGFTCPAGFKTQVASSAQRLSERWASEETPLTVETQHGSSGTADTAHVTVSCACFQGRD